MGLMDLLKKYVFLLMECLVIRKIFTGCNYSIICQPNHVTPVHMLLNNLLQWDKIIIN